MAQQVKSRTQRRMEKKQALLLVVLLLGISLVSFFLGIMVGRNSSRADAVPSQVVVASPLPVAPVPPKPAPGSQPAVESEPQKDALTFYDTLAQGEQAPLGSGINLPPEAKPVPVTESRPLVVAPEEVAPIAPSPPPKAVAQGGGGYVVQVASFKQLTDALSLRDQLTKKGYIVFTQGAALGDKGVWYRVMVGPYADNGAAKQAAEYLQVHEKLAGIVKKE